MSTTTITVEPVASAPGATLTGVDLTQVRDHEACRLRWSRDTLAIWDNRCTVHNAVNDYSGVRQEMYRTRVVGAGPAALA
jgi:hypothetical protein